MLSDRESHVSLLNRFVFINHRGHLQQGPSSSDTQSLLEAFTQPLMTEKKKQNKNVIHLKHKYVSEQEISGCHHTAKACKDGGLISMGCLTLAFMLRGFSKNDLQLKVLVFRCRRKILSPV